MEQISISRQITPVSRGMRRLLILLPLAAISLDTFGRQAIDNAKDA